MKAFVYVLIVAVGLIVVASVYGAASPMALRAVSGKTSMATVAFKNLEHYEGYCEIEQGQPVGILRKEWNDGYMNDGKHLLWYYVRERLAPACEGWTLAETITFD